MALSCGWTGPKQAMGQKLTDRARTKRAFRQGSDQQRVDLIAAGQGALNVEDRLLEVNEIIKFHSFTGTTCLSTMLALLLGDFHDVAIR